MFEQKGGYLDGLSKAEIEALFPLAAKDHQKHCQYNAKYYSPCLNGESPMETAERVREFFPTILRDYKERNIRHLVIVCHGVTLRAFIKTWMHYLPEWYEGEQTPGNCWARHLEGTSTLGYHDHGYVYGEGAPLGDCSLTQIPLKNAKNIFILKPERPNAMVPIGADIFDPWAPDGP